MQRFSKQKGIATLVLAIIVLAVVTVITLFTARVILMDQKIYKNVYGKSAASNAAQAGFEYALGYLVSNASTVTTNLSSCPSTDTTYTLSAGTNSPLADQSTFTMTYGCVTTSDTNTLRITSIGTSFDSAATNTVTALVKAWNGAFSSYAVIGRANDSVSGDNSVDIRNTVLVYNTNAGAIRTMAGGGTVRLRNSAASRTSTTSPYGSPYSCAAAITIPPAPASTNCQDISYSNTTLSAMTSANFETNFIGRAVTDFAALSPAYTITCTASGTTTFNAASSTLGSGGGATPSGCTCTPMPGCGTATLVTASASGGIIYFDMTGSTPNLTIRTNGTSSTLGAVATHVIFAINNTTGNTTFTANNSNDVMTINGNIYTNTADATARTTTISDTGGGSAAVTLNGILFSTGEVRLLNTVTIYGVIAGGQVNLQDNSAVYYTPANITNTYNGYYGSYLTPSASGGASSYGIVSGSWKDF